MLWFSGNQFMNLFMIRNSSHEIQEKKPHRNSPVLLICSRLDARVLLQQRHFITETPEKLKAGVEKALSSVCSWDDVRTTWNVLHFHVVGLKVGLSKTCAVCLPINILSVSWCKYTIMLKCRRINRLWCAMNNWKCWRWAASVRDGTKLCLDMFSRQKREQ